LGLSIRGRQTGRQKKAIGTPQNGDRGISMRGWAMAAAACLMIGFAATARAEIGLVAPTESAVAACIHTLSQRYDKQSPGLDLASRPDSLWADVGLATYPHDGPAACADGFEDKLGDPELGAPTQQE
jgi:hypothetical protein